MPPKAQTMKLFSFLTVEIRRPFQFLHPYGEIPNALFIVEVLLALKLVHMHSTLKQT